MDPEKTMDLVTWDAFSFCEVDAFNDVDVVRVSVFTLTQKPFSLRMAGHSRERIERGIKVILRAILPVNGPEIELSGGS